MLQILKIICFIIINCTAKLGRRIPIPIEVGNLVSGFSFLLFEKSQRFPKIRPWTIIFFNSRICSFLHRHRLSFSRFHRKHPTSTSRKYTSSFGENIPKIQWTLGTSKPTIGSWGGNKNRFCLGTLLTGSNTQWPLLFKLRAAVDYLDYIHSEAPSTEIFGNLLEKNENGNPDGMQRANRFQ